MKDSGDRRRRRICLAATLATIAAVAVTIAVLAAVLLRVRSPSTELLSARVDGISPRLSIPSFRIQFNLTLALQIRVHNPNFASFSHAPGTAELYYAGSLVGEASVAAGRVPARGSEIAACELTLEADRVAAAAGGIAGLAADVAAGEVAVESRARIPGRVVFLGFFKHHAVATSDCHLVIGMLPEMRVKSQSCTDRTVL